MGEPDEATQTALVQSAFQVRSACQPHRRRSRRLGIDVEGTGHEASDCNRPVPYDGVLRNQTSGRTQRITFMFTVTRTGLVVNAPVRAFSGCVKTRIFNYSAGQSRDPSR